jgi:hypothetical protein
MHVPHFPKRFARSAVLLSATLFLGIAVAVPASTATKTRSHALNLTAVFRALVAPSASFTSTGTIAGTPFGQGAIVRQVTAVGNALSVKFTWFATNGSVSGTAKETRTIHPNGSVTFAVTTGRITRGGGAYRGAGGKFSGTGTEPNLSSPVTEHLQGAATY